MHAEARAFVAHAVSDKRFERVVEFGSRDVNGTVRDLFVTDRYHGIDIEPGPGVDEVANAVIWSPAINETPDCVVCCEVLEHTEDWRLIVYAAYDALDPGGLFVVTCATDPRAPHSASDGGALRDDEHYENIDPIAFIEAVEDAGFELLEHLVIARGDLQAVMVRR